jgi:hypothetical protein
MPVLLRQIAWCLLAAASAAAAKSFQDGYRQGFQNG